MLVNRQANQFMHSAEEISEVTMLSMRNKKMVLATSKPSPIKVYQNLRSHNFTTQKLAELRKSHKKALDW